MKLLDPNLNLEGHGVLSDSAFPVSDEIAGILALSNAITSMRQSAEWGMGAVEKVYRQLLLPLPFDQDVRSRRLETIYRLYNYRVRTTGISQIKSYFGLYN
eukprot:gene17879-24991_t